MLVHWDFFTTSITHTREPFALMRYVDGERMILQGAAVSTSTQAFSEDKWSFEGGASALQADMLASLSGHYGEPVFYAFASPQDDENGLRWYLERTEATCGQITLANLWINSYYARTKALLLDLIATQAFRERGVYDVPRVRQLLDEHRDIVMESRPVDNHMMFFWQLVNLELWLAATSP